ncbi:MULTISPECIES: hypothetical protein [unclassified Rhizobacter]|uniref:hypothetical protein n=1 Tax=unclassified Rhizobacter TaxID=2640088 RepID=UPI000712F948|nr:MULTISPECIES: hypothetical protein [unclassified Rhizobacter]KQU80674.1 hypothetical protein ASC88_13960 [Rhizobacter sp. Root29]
MDNGTNRMKTVQEAKGHGLKAWPYASNFNGAANQDGIVYYPTLGTPGHPLSGNGCATAASTATRRRGSSRSWT